MEVPMADRIRAFDFEIDVTGATVIPLRDPLIPSCLTVDEIDAQILLLKKDLDAVARRMRSAIRAQAEIPPFGAAKA
jgi:hypothetical protein